MKHLTFVLPYYMNPGMLALQYATWAAYDRKLLARTSFVIVDDGSPIEPAAEVERPAGLDIAIYRVEIDLPWHQHGARNIGAHEAGNGWLLLTDMDHVLPAGSLARLFLLKKRDAIYTLRRLDADTMEPSTRDDGSEKPHPNTFVMTRALFWRIGGYDEDYCGIYGTDGVFRSRAFAMAPEIHLPDAPILRYWRDLVPDASTRTLARKEGRDPGAKSKVADEKRRRGEADVIRVLQAPYERVV